MRSRRTSKGGSKDKACSDESGRFEVSDRQPTACGRGALNSTSASGATRTSRRGAVLAATRPAHVDRHRVDARPRAAAGKVALLSSETTALRHPQTLLMLPIVLSPAVPSAPNGGSMRTSGFGESVHSHCPSRSAGTEPVSDQFVPLRWSGRSGVGRCALRPQVASSTCGSSTTVAPTTPSRAVHLRIRPRRFARVIGDGQETRHLMVWHVVPSGGLRIDLIVGACLASVTGVEGLGPAPPYALLPRRFMTCVVRPVNAREVE